MAEVQGGSAEGNKGSSRKRWIWAATAIILLSLAAFFVFQRRSKSATEGHTGKGPGAGRSGGPGAGGPVMVDVAPSQTTNIGVYVSALGLVTPMNTVAVRSRVEGQLFKTHYTEGQLVKEGDPLAEID